MKLKPSIIAISTLIASTSAVAEELNTIVVEADFRPTQVDESTSSVSVISGTEAEQLGATHMETLINQVPNMNAAAGASRQQFFQIRGIGERSQYEYPVNPSVGLMIDGMNFSHTGAAATLFDTEQVEVLRGPQGTRFGANALAGIINIQSKEATETPEHEIEMTYGNFNSSRLGAVLSGPIIDNKVLGRIAIQQSRSDGYMENDYLDKTDTQNQDEITAKAHLKIMANDKHTIDLRATHLNIDNGYDGFNMENDLTTITDEPGKDKLKADAVALKSEYKLNPKVNMVTKLSHMSSSSLYSFDADWAYPDYQGGWDQYFAEYDRSRTENTLEFNWLSSPEGKIFNNSTDWVFGLYASNYSEDMIYEKSWSSSNEEFELDTQNRAAFGQFDIALNDKATLTTGLRVEQYTANISTNTGIKDNHNETLFGGKIGLTYQANDNHQVFGSFSRGYKAGGLNVEPNLLVSQLPYDTEYMWSLEAGLNSKFANRLSTRLNFFYSKRVDQQVKSSVQTDPNDPQTFTDYFTNAALGETYGLEFMGNWQATNNLRLMSSLGLLKNKFIDYTNPEAGELDGRDQAHSPNYQFSLTGEYEINNNWLWMANMQRKDAFYFSNNHDSQSKSYTLFNTSLEYSNDDVSVNFWIRNLMNTEYDVRGFFFAVDQSTWEPAEYTQLGEPRTFGVTARYFF
ncbi:TonB-dependent receptor [Thiomicrorhabdus chilensis]|uniref:TonB-dependent receptor n=1 Tax=Thiomicrorhabdus chilensis TaxID=63656 RepID=UPI0004035649|nr:TonB-dependent receptor [Thiomicrorhabdus chilensis]